MPVLQISEDDLSEPSDFATLRVLALMLYPDDAIARRRMEHAWRALLISHLSESVEPDEKLNPRGMIKLIQYTAAAPDIFDILEGADLKRRVRDGRMAGWVLLSILSRHKSGGVASLKKAKLGAAKKYKVSMSKVEAVWVTYKPVAPLWGAFLFETMAPTDLGLLLAASEYLRREAESFVPKQSSKGAILRPGEAFSVAPEIQLPSVEFTFERPS